MKNGKFLLLLILSLGISIFFLFGYNPENKLHLKLAINEENLTFLKSHSGDIAADNNNKFGGDVSKSSLDIQIYDLVELLTEDELESYTANIKGVVKTNEGNFNFIGEGELFKTQITEVGWVYTGSFEGEIRNKKGNETVNISLRHNPETDESDVVVVGGVVGNTGVLPYGQPFLYDNHLTEIKEKINRDREGGSNN